MARLHTGPTAHRAVSSRRSVPEPVSTAPAVEGGDLLGGRDATGPTDRTGAEHVRGGATGGPFAADAPDHPAREQNREDRPRLRQRPCASPDAHGTPPRPTCPPWSKSTVTTVSTGRAVRRGDRHTLQADRRGGRAVAGRCRRAPRRHVQGWGAPRHTWYSPVRTSWKNLRLPQRAGGHGYSMQKEAGAFPPA